MSEELTAYEQQRLANIERNVAFLASLGLASVKPPATSKSKSRTTSEKELDGEYRERKKARVARKGSSSDPPARRSARVMNQPAPAIEVDSDDELYGVKKAAKKRQRDRQIRGGQVRGDGADKGGEEGEDDGEDRDLVRYDCFPHSCEEVDDFEFQVFLIVRRWRHATCNALGLEPYKIFQNRTVLEVVRRQRNDESFATQQDSLALSKQLIEVWGIGPSKVALPGDECPYGEAGGYAHQMIALLRENADEVEGLLQQSRALSPGSGSATSAGEGDDNGGEGEKEDAEAEAK